MLWQSRVRRSSRLRDAIRAPIRGVLDELRAVRIRYGTDSARDTSGTLWFGPGSHGSMLRWYSWLGLLFGRSLDEGHRHSGNFGTREVQCRLLRSVDATVP